MFDPTQPEAGNLFVAVSTADGKVHSTTLEAKGGTWSAFDDVSSPATQGGRAQSVTVTPYRQVASVDNRSLLRYFREQGVPPPPPPWVGRLLGTGFAGASAGVAGHGAEFAVLGLSAPTGGAFAFSLPLLFVNGPTITPVGDQLAGVTPGALPAGDIAIAFDISGNFGPNEWSFDLCLATASGGLYYARKIIYHGVPVGPPPVFEDVKSRSGSALGDLVSVSCSSGSAGLHLAVVDTAGTIWHSIRDRAGNWAPFANVNTATGSTAQFSQVAIAAFDGPWSSDPILHLLAVDGPGDLLHTIRQAGGTWGTFSSVKATAGDPGPVTSVDAGAWPWSIP